MPDAPIFVDLQGFIVNDKFTVKEVAVLRNNGRDLIHYIFHAPMSWDLLTKAEKSRACWLTANHHSFRWDDGCVDYALARTLIRNAVRDGSKDELGIRAYVKGSEKKKWLAEIIGDAENVALSTIDADYEDIGRLQILSTARTLRCGRHERNCAMENVLKLYNWWCERCDRLEDIQSTDI